MAISVYFVLNLKSKIIEIANTEFRMMNIEVSEI